MYRGYDTGVLVHLLLALALEVDFVRLAILLVEVDGRGDVEVMEEARNVEQYRMAALCSVSGCRRAGCGLLYLGHAKQLYRRPATVEHAFFGLDLLEDEALLHLAVVVR